MPRAEDKPAPQNDPAPLDRQHVPQADWGVRTDCGAQADWGVHADAAARAVTRQFGQRLFFLPGTHIAAIVRPSNGLRNLARPWHYWWQAQYLDCLVDAGRRERATGKRFDGDTRPSAGRLASRLLTTIGLRNFFRFTNNYYDDMAWLALAILRLGTLAEEPRKSGRRRIGRIRDRLTLEFETAASDDLGGGVFWSKQRDFKNTPATAPVALFFVRTGRTAWSQRLLDWLGSRLFDVESGLYLDGLRIRGGEVVLEDGVYTYNQGPVLGALLELGGEANLARAADLVAAVERHLCLPGPPADSGQDAGSGRDADRVTAQDHVIARDHVKEPEAGPAAAQRSVIRCEGTGDGGLFTGILLRYLGLAASDSRLPAAVRAAARRMVVDTAAAFWAGRDERPDGWLTFPANPPVPAGAAYPPGAVVELSTQLQAWMALEAAAAIT